MSTTPIHCRRTERECHHSAYLTIRCVAEVHRWEERYSLLAPTAAEQFGEREMLAFRRVLAGRLPSLGKGWWRTVHVLGVAVLRGVGREPFSDPA